MVKSHLFFCEGDLVSSFVETINDGGFWNNKLVLMLGDEEKKCACKVYLHI